MTPGGVRVARATRATVTTRASTASGGDPGRAAPPARRCLRGSQGSSEVRGCRGRIAGPAGRPGCRPGRSAGPAAASRSRAGPANGRRRARCRAPRRSPRRSGPRARGAPRPHAAGSDVASTTKRRAVRSGSPPRSTVAQSLRVRARAFATAASAAGPSSVRAWAKRSSDGVRAAAHSSNPPATSPRCPSRRRRGVILSGSGPDAPVRRPGRRAPRAGPPGAASARRTPHGRAASARTPRARPGREG